MNHFYQLSTFLFLLFVLPVSFATAGNEAPLMNVAVAPGDLSATISGDSIFCAGSDGAIVFEGTGGNAPYTFTYQVNGGALQMAYSSALNGIANVQVNTSVSGSFTYRITSIKGATGKATLVDISRVIIILAAPVVDFSTTGTACSGSPVPFTSSVQGAGMYSYLWDFGDGQTSTEEDPTHEFSSTGCGTAAFTVNLTVTDGNGCSATRSHSITVLQKPDISFSDLNFPFGEPFNNCGSASAASPDYTIRVGNTSLSAGCIDSYSIDWGDGSAPVAKAIFPASHTYASLGAFEMVITSYGANGCSNAITYVVRNMNNPSVGITSPGTTTNLCAPTAALGFEIAKWGTNSPGTTYRVDYGDGSAVLTLTQEQMKASAYYNIANPSASANYPIPHSYLLPNCPNGPYMVHLIATNACSSTEATVNNITVFNKSTPDFKVTTHACVNSSVAITNTSIPGYNTSCTQTSIYTWDYGDGTAQEVTGPTLPKNTSHTYTTPGEYTIKLTSKNICGESSATSVITIDPPLTAIIDGNGMISGTVNVCQNDPAAVITFTGTNGTAPYTFTYRINNGSLQTITTAPGSSSVTIAVPTNATGSFTYTLVSISDASPTACTQVQTGAVTVIVSAPPSASISGNASACINDASPQITFTGSGGTRPYTFSYTVNGGPVQTITTNAVSNSVTLAVPTTVAGVFKYTLIGVQDNGAATCSRVVSAMATVTINQKPASMILPDYEYCNGETTSLINFTNAVAGTTYRWINSNTSIGLAASGNGSIPSFAARNSTGAPVTATITVTPSVNGCDGASQTFTITVEPSAVLFSRGGQTICSGDNTAQVTLSSPSGAALSWSAASPAGITGVVASGTNIIPVQTLVNTTSAPITVIFTATAALPVSDPCAGTQYFYSIIVNPKPAVTQAFTQEICSGSAFTVSPQVNAGNSIPSGTRYTWSAPVISPSGAITGAGAQAIPQASISQTLVNTTSTAATATYTITPVANGCSGNPFTVVVTVLPLPTAIISGSTTVCQDASMPLVTFTGSGGTAPYTFSYKINSGPVQTISTDATTSSATVSMPTDLSGSFTYTLVSVQDKGTTGCVKSQTGSVTVVVSAPPSGTISGNATACLNDASPVITFTGSGGIRPYTFSYTINGGAVQTIPTYATSNSVTVNVPTTATGVFKYNLVEVKDGGIGNCSRTLNTSATVTVNELPAVMTLPDYTYCNGETASVIPFNNAVAGTTYRWINSNPSIGLPASGTGSIPSFIVLNTTSSPVTSIITVISSVNGCNGPAQSFTITVQPSPVVTFSMGSQIICSGENTVAVTFGSTTPGAQFGWVALPSAGISGVITSGTNILPVQTLVNTTSAPVTVTYQAKVTTSGTVNCEGVEAAYSITVNPKPAVTQTFTQEVCSGSTFTVSPQVNAGNSIPSGTKYRWGAPVINPVGAITGAGAQAIPQASISQMLVNITSAVATASYIVTPIANGCAGDPFTIEVSVLPLPNATITGSATVCQNSPKPLVTFTGANGTAPYTFSYTVNGGAVRTITTTSGNSITDTVPTDMAGSYVYTLVGIQDKGTIGCMQAQSGSVTVVVSAPPSASIDGSTTACLNDASAVITFTGSGGTGPYYFTYNINGGAAITSGPTSSDKLNLIVPTDMAGVFTYRLIGVKDSGAGGCIRAVTDSASVTVTEMPAVMTLADETYCHGEVTPGIVFTNAVPGTTYRWTNSNPSIGLPASGTGSIGAFTALNTTSSPITSTITVIPSVNGCNGPAQSFIISVQPSPVVAFSMGSQTICSGDKTAAVTLTSSTAGVQFSWSAVSPAGITGIITSGTNILPVQTLVNSTSDPITVIYQAKATTSGTVSCEGVEATYSITVNPSPLVINQPEGSVVCLGEKPAPLSVAVTGTGIPSYQWYSNTSNSTSGGFRIPNATGVSYDPPYGVAGTVYYYCQVTFAGNNCNGLTSSTAEVTVLPNPIISAVDQEISSGESFMVTPAWGNGNIVPPGTAYIWSTPEVSPDGAVSGATAQSVPQAMISQRLVNITEQPATVTYTVFPVSGACTGASFKVTVYVDSPLSPHISVTPIACYGGNNGSIVTDIQGGALFAQGAPYTILWTGPNGYTSTDASIYNLAPGVYLLSVTDSRGKQITAETAITAPEELMVVIDEKKDVSCYGASDGRIFITVKGGTGPYQASWTKDTMPFALTEDIANLAPGTYEVTVKDANGCVPKIMSWVISQPDPLTVALTGKSDIRCYGDSAGYIAVEVTGGQPAYRYHWTGPDGFSSADKDLSHLTAGDYHLEVTDMGGCIQSLAVTLTEPSPLAVEAQTTPISCYGANNATIRLNVTGGTPPYQADWNNYASGTYQDNLSAGDYTIVITDAYQCQIITTVKIPEAQVLRMNPEVKNVSCYGARNGSISLNFETTLKSIILTWSDNVRSGTTRNNIGPGVYTVNIKGENLCVLNRTFVITEPDPLALTATVTDITNCSSVAGGAIDLMVTGGTPPYSYAWSNGAVAQDQTNLQAGNYAITVTDSEGCAQVAQYTVRRPVPLVADVETNIDFNCASGDVKAYCTAKVSGGVTPYQIKWSAGEVSGQNNEQMETRQSGIVVLIVTDQTGCSVSRSFSIDVPAPGIISREADCNNHVFQFDGVPPVESEAITYSWDFGDGTVSGLRNPQHTYSVAGTYNVRLTITTAGGCVVVYHEVVDAALPPVVGIDKEPRFCPGDSVFVHGTGAATYRWNDGTSEDGIWISREGNYSVTGTSAAGCSATYDFKASYYDLIGYTILSDQKEVSSGANRIHFWSENIPYSAYRWDFGDGQSGQGVETFHSYEISDDGYIDVSLTVTNPNGCEEKATKRIWKSVTAIANTFTPNGDGYNDIYLKGWQIQVFNRNGVLMYQGDTGWDGKHEGRLVDNDTYFVIIYDSTQLGAKYKKSYVTVLR